MTRYVWVLGVLGIVGVLVAGAIWFVSGALGAPGQVAAVLGAAALVAYGVLDRDKLAAEASTREVFASASAAIAMVLALVLAVVGVALVRDWDQTWDLTRDQRHSLSPRSATVVDGLQAPLEIYGLFRKNTPEREAFERLAGLYAARSDRVTMQAIDPLTEPARARALLQATGNEELDRVAETGAVLLVTEGRRRRIEADFTQTRLTNAIVKLTSGEDHRVCWSIGHGERSADDDQSARGFGALVLRLEDRNATVVEQRILGQGVDRACSVLVIAGPTVDLQPRELEAIAAYVAEGGQVLALLDTPLVEGAATPAFDAELHRYGILVDADVILENDPDHVLPDATGEPLFVYDTRAFKEHPILDGLPSGLAVRWPRSVRSSDDRPGIVVRNLVDSTGQSWADRSYTRATDEQPRPDPEEILGPVTFVALAEVLDPTVLEVEPPAAAPPPDRDALERAFEAPRASLVPADLKPVPGGRVMVIGDADLGGNALSTLLDNGDLLLNAITFLVGDEEQLGSDAEPSQYLVLTTSQLAILFLIGVLLLPGGAAVAGGVLVVRRRFL